MSFQDRMDLLPRNLFDDVQGSEFPLPELEPLYIPESTDNESEDMIKHNIKTRLIHNKQRTRNSRRKQLSQKYYEARRAADASGMPMRPVERIRTERQPNQMNPMHRDFWYKDLKDLQIKIKHQEQYLAMLEELNGKKGFDLNSHIERTRESIRTDIPKAERLMRLLRIYYPNLVLGKKRKSQKSREKR
jgi:hypothetical protein